MIIGVMSTQVKAITFQPSNTTKAVIGRNYQLKVKILKVKYVDYD